MSQHTTPSRYTPAVVESLGKGRQSAPTQMKALDAARTLLREIEGENP